MLCLRRLGTSDVPANEKLASCTLTGQDMEPTRSRGRRRQESAHAPEDGYDPRRRFTADYNKRKEDTYV